MEIKKAPSADLERQKGFFFLLGLILSLGTLYIAFELSQREIEVYQNDISYENAEMEEMMQTAEPEPPEQAPEPPAPAEIPPEVKVVDHEVKSNTDVFTEVKPSEAVVVAPPPAPAPIAKPVEKEDDVIFQVVEKSAEYPGGMQELYKFLNKNLNYPAAAKEAGIQGRVVCQFVVNKDGSLVDVKIVRGLDPDLDREALRVINMMPKWKPGEQSGKKVRQRYTLPVQFKLN